MLTNSLNWPGDPSEYVVRVITQDRELASAFNTMANKRQINGKPIKISFSNYVSIPDGLQVLYVTEDYSETLQDVIDDIAGKPILIITEGSSDQEYMMINMVDLPDGLSFQYMSANIQNQGIRLKPEFRDLGGEEINVAELYAEAKSSVRSMKDRSLSGAGQLDTLNMLTAVAVKLGSSLYNQANEMEAEIARQKVALDKVLRLLAERGVQLDEINQAIALKKDSIRWGRQLIIEQAASIDRAEQVIEDKDAELARLKLVLDNQLEILIFLVAFALLFILALVLAYKAYHARQRAAKKLNEQKQELDELLERLRSTQDQLILSEKLMVVGSLTDSFANEITNAINYVFSGTHVIEKRFAETREVLNDVRQLSTEDSQLKMKMKVRAIAEKSSKIEFDDYDSVIETMISSVAVGAEKIIAILKDLEPYTQFTELGKFGLTVLGRSEDEQKEDAG